MLRFDRTPIRGGSSPVGGGRARSRVTLGIVASMMTLALTVPTLVIVPSASADTLQMSSDNLETSWYPNEPQLTPSAVTGGNFGQVFNTGLTGQVYAQPLVSQPMVLAVTEKDYAYGLNSSTGAIMWQDNFGPAADPLAQTNCGDIGANMGITGTPVIDPATDVAYFVAATGTGTQGATQYFMDAVNVQTGAPPTGWPSGGVPIQGAADNDPGTVFNGQWQTQRPGLVLVNGVVYAAFGSQCDYGSWDGWLIGVSESSASITTMWASETGQSGGGGAGIWQSGSAPVVDSQGNIYLATGNGQVPTSPAAGTNTSVTKLGEAVVKLSTTGGKLHLADWFIPANGGELNTYDDDLGAGGTVALPPSMGTSQVPNVLLQIGKGGVLYALNRDSLGGYQQGPSGTDAVPFESAAGGPVWSKPAVWPGDGGYVYFPTTGSVSSTYPNTAGGALDAYQRVVNGSGDVTFQLVGATSNSGTTFPFGSGKPIITSNGTTSGSALLWITHPADSSGSTSELQAYNPIPQNPGPQGTLTEVWHASIGSATKFSEPVVDNGNIYVGTKNGTSDGALLGFGFLQAPTLTGADVNFSPRIVSQSATMTATFTASASTTISSLTETGAAFSVGTPSLSLPATLSAGQTLTVPVTFTPNALGTLSGTLTANNTGPAAVVALSGQGLSASSLLSASPSSATFTIQPIGGPVVHQLVTFTNVSANSVAITGFTAPALPFSVSNPPGNTTLKPGDTLSFTVDFSPPGSSGNFVQTFSSVATLSTGDGDFGVPVSGSAAPPAQINIVPTTLSFGSVQVGSSAKLTFDVGNQGGLPLLITTSTPPSTKGFSSITSPTNLTNGTSLPANTSLQETVQFAPTTTGTLSSTWVIEGNDGSGAQTVTITGTGVAAPPPAQINIVPTTLSFGSVQVGSSAKLNFDVGNIGAEPLTITTSTPPSTEGFSAITTLASGKVFAANTSLQETVQFAPTTTGTLSSTWVIEGNDGSGAQTVTITGTGVAAPPPPPPPPPTSGGSGGSGGSGASGGSGGSVPPSVQPTLTITTLAGHVGSPLSLSTNGDADGGAVTYRVSNGTATGCVIAGNSLTVTSAGTCIVTATRAATRAASGTSAAVSSPATTITIAPEIATSSPNTISITFAARSDALSAVAKKALRHLAVKLVPGASVTVTGFAKGDAVLAKSRASAVATYLASLVKIHRTLKSVTNGAVNRATVVSTNH